MANMATYRGVTPVTIIAGSTGNVTLLRGTRVALSTDGSNVCYLQDASARGDYVTMQDIAPGQSGAAIRTGGGEGVVLLVTGITVALNDRLYSAANGQTTNVATGAQYLGKAREAGAGGTLIGILLEGAA